MKCGWQCFNGSQPTESGSNTQPANFETKRIEISPPVRNTRSKIVFFVLPVSKDEAKRTSLHFSAKTTWQENRRLYPKWPAVGNREKLPVQMTPASSPDSSKSHMVVNIVLYFRERDGQCEKCLYIHITGLINSILRTVPYALDSLFGK